jgi:DNA relaxase NicK
MFRKVATVLYMLYEVKLMASLSRDQNEECYCNGDIMDSLDRTVGLLNSTLNLSYTKYCSEWERFFYSSIWIVRLRTEQSGSREHETDRCMPIKKNSSCSRRQTRLSAAWCSLLRRLGRFPYTYHTRCDLAIWGEYNAARFVRGGPI